MPSTLRPLSAHSNLGVTLSEVLRAALSAYLRDRDGYWQAVTPPSVDGPSQPAFSHEQTAVKPWRWERPLGYEHGQATPGRH